MDSRKGFRWVLAVVVLLIGLLTIRVFFRDGPTETEANAPAAVAIQDEPVQNSKEVFSAKAVPRPDPFPKEITLLPIAQESLKLNRADSTPQDDLELLEVLLGAYRRALKENPSGENGEIVAALMGRNLRGVAVIPANHPALGADRQLLDRWGTPYSFHSVSSQATEIISAGPDRKLWTQDDIVLK